MIFPSLLKSGDKIAIVSPAGKLQANDLVGATKILSSWGLQVVLGDHVYDSDNYFAGKDEVRLKDIQQALDDPSIMAILCGRGGYGITRIIEKIDLKAISAKPKWVIGFSDITALHLKLARHKIASIHGPLATSFANSTEPVTINSLKSLLFSGVSKLTAKQGSIRSGAVAAPLTGGNLSLILDSLGTADEIDTRNKILFIEEIGEKTYKIDRMFQQLLRAGKLENLAGLVIGHFSQIDEQSSPFGESWQEVVTNIVKSSTYPLAFGFGFGHEPENNALVMGGLYKLEVKSDLSTLEWDNMG